jgi:hypothetical protein
LQSAVGGVEGKPRRREFVTLLTHSSRYHTPEVRILGLTRWMERNRR